MMNETLGGGYARIEALRGVRADPPTGQEAPPPDRHNFVYFTLFIAGVAFLLPYNSFIMAVDYFQHHFPGTTVMFDMSTVYILCACIAVVTNNVFLDMYSHNVRITFGIILSLFTMLFVAAINIGWDCFSPRISYNINLFGLMGIAIGCTVQQASYYGFTGSLPPRYTQAVMLGESVAGFYVSLDRIATKYIFEQPRRSTFMFFMLAILVLICHAVLHQVMMRHPLVQYYLKLTHESRRRRRIQLHLNPNDDVTLVENERHGEGTFGELQLQSPTTNGEEAKSFSFANPVYSPTSRSPPAAVPTPRGPLEPPSSAFVSPRTSYKVEDVVLEAPERPWTWRCFTRFVSERWTVARAIYPYMVSIGLVYFTTLSLYPGIASEITSCQLGSWMPIVLMSTFNCFDVIGKVAAAWPYEWRSSQLLMASGVRLLLVPLMLLCAAPRPKPHIVGDIYPVMFSIVLGFSNGLFGSIPMIAAPSRVSREFREIAGNMMTLSYNGGLLSGSLVSYLLLDILGSRSGSASPCKSYPTPLLPTVPTTTTTTTMAVNLTHLVLPFH